jgi:hypothetical protein
MVMTHKYYCFVGCKIMEFGTQIPNCSKTLLLWHADLMLRNDHEISDHTTAVVR